MIIRITNYPPTWHLKGADYLKTKHVQNSGGSISEAICDSDGPLSFGLIPTIQKTDLKTVFYVKILFMLPYVECSSDDLT